MNFDVTADDASESSDKFVDLSWVSTTDSVSDADPVHAYFVDGLVYGEKVDEVGAEGVFRRKSDLDSLGLDKGDDLDRSLCDVGHVFSVRELA